MKTRNSAYSKRRTKAKKQKRNRQQLDSSGRLRVLCRFSPEEIAQMRGDTCLTKAATIVANYVRSHLAKERR